MKQRTKGQNEILVGKILDYLASGRTMKEVAEDFGIPHWTVTSIFARYRKRYKFKTSYQMLAAHVTIKSRKQHERLCTKRETK